MNRIGWWAGISAATATIAYVVVQVLQVLGVLHFPFDEILIFATSLCIVVPFVLEMLALHYTRPAELRFWTHAALIFTTMYAVFGTANYVVQLATVIPAKLRGAAGSIQLLGRDGSLRCRLLLSDLLQQAPPARLPVGHHRSGVHAVARRRTSTYSDSVTVGPTSYRNV